MIDTFIEATLAGIDDQATADDGHERLEAMSHALTDAKDAIGAAQLRVQDEVTAWARNHPPVLSEDHTELGVNMRETIEAQDAIIEQQRQQILELQAAGATTEGKA